MQIITMQLGIFKKIIYFFLSVFILFLASADSKPNILLLESDQHKPDALSCMGHPVVKTPAMDSLAETGILFTDTVCPSPVCMASRTSRYFGKYPYQTGLWNNDFSGMKLDCEEDFSIVKGFKSLGYRTGFVGKYHLKPSVEIVNSGKNGSDAVMKQLGFDFAIQTSGKVYSGVSKRNKPWLLNNKSWCRYIKWMLKRYPEEYEAYRSDMMLRSGFYPDPTQTYEGVTGPDGTFYPPFKGEARSSFIVRPSPLPVHLFPDQWISDQTAHLVERMAREEEPFFIWANWGGPHYPFDAPGKYAELYRHKRDYETLPASIPPSPHETLPPNMISLDRSIPPNDEVKRAYKENYYGLINLVDDGIAKIVERLKKIGEYENTIVIYISDHGEMLGNHGRQSKSNMFYHSVNVPMIVSWPAGFAQGKVIDSQAELFDIMKTLLEELGLKNSPIEGMNFADVLKGKTDQGPRKYAFSQIQWGAYKYMMVKSKEFKYIRCVLAPGKKGTELTFLQSHVLFDLTNDPQERVNQSENEAYQKILSDMQVIMEERLSGWEENPFS